MDFENNFKQFLKDKSQESEEEGITKKEMLELQEAINKSKQSASVEEEQREFNRQSKEIQRRFYKSDSNVDDTVDTPAKEKPFTAKQWTKQPKSPIDVSNVDTEPLGSQKEFTITFQDLLEVSGQSLDIIFHTPVFDLPTPTNPQYKRLSIQEQAKLLFNYYTRVDKLRIKLAKESLYRAPCPKPIQPSNRCKNSLLKTEIEDENGTIDDFLDQVPVQDVYVSRAGRQIKRKIYTEDTEGDSDPDFAFSVKKNKSDDSDTKIIMDTPYIPEENNSEQKPVSKAAKARKDTPRRPLSLSTKKPTCRSDMMFEKMVVEEEKKKQVQEEMDHFQKSLTNVEEVVEDVLCKDVSPDREIQVDSDENFVRKRVVPPLPAKRGGRAKKPPKQEDFDKIETKPDSPVLKSYSSFLKYPESRSKQKSKLPKSKETPAAEESATSTSKLKKQNCPICNKEFLQNEIENHAANCGIEDEAIEEFEEDNRSTLAKITCELCEREFLMNTEYEVHVKNCIASKITDL